jgi:hypothetical protein
MPAALIQIQAVLGMIVGELRLIGMAAPDLAPADVDLAIVQNRSMIANPAG